MTVEILIGDCRDVLRAMRDCSADCIVTSPPYWRQRDYGVAGQIGQELSPEEWVDELVTLFLEARRVLAPLGTLWVNVGDKYAAGGNGGGGSLAARRKAWRGTVGRSGWRTAPPGYKSKD